MQAANNDKIKLKEIIGRITLWMIAGFFVGLLIGFFVMKGYIVDYTNECVQLYNDCISNCSNKLW